MAKGSNKTKNVSIRFDIEKIEFLMTKRNCNSFQKCVDYLLDKFFWEMGGDCLSTIPMQNTNHNTNLTLTNPKEQLLHQPQKETPIQLGVYESYKLEFSNARSADDIAITLREMKKESLLPKERIELEAFATQVFNDKGFYHD